MLGYLDCGVYYKELVRRCVYASHISLNLQLSVFVAGIELMTLMTFTERFYRCYQL